MIELTIYEVNPDVQDFAYSRVKGEILDKPKMALHFGPLIWICSSF